MDYDEIKQRDYTFTLYLILFISIPAPIAGILGIAFYYFRFKKLNTELYIQHFSWVHETLKFYFVVTMTGLLFWTYPIVQIGLLLIGLWGSWRALRGMYYLHKKKLLYPSALEPK